MDLDILTRLTAANRWLPAPPGSRLAGLSVQACGTRRIDPPTGQDLDREGQQFHGLTYIVHGEADFLEPGPVRRIRGGDILLLPAGQAYRYRSCDGRGWRAAWIRWDCDPAHIAALGLAAGPLAAGIAARQAFAEVLGLATTTGSPGPRLAAALARLLAELAIAGERRRPSDDRVDAALAAMRAEPLRAWDLDALARQHGMSTSALRQGLRRRTGLAPARLLRSERLRRGAEALGNGFSVSAAAQAAGCADPFHFSRLFRNAYGCAPRDWRRLVGG